ncbi:MAG: NAD-dependent epimerase/dehydratase family protein [Actinobacteria bacterium]|uniref:Unannotated protein n=1 Tax=freshwater metagenome TaxID=449393 RepID=A0A6J5YM30_9ZZZZ|nr:NAD-dependent epimerase/dehydratase family protein [Actinomycetota bacterium]
MTLNQSRILVSGATGFIGSNLVQYFARQGHLVIGTYRDRSDNSKPKETENIQWLRLEDQLGSSTIDQVIALRPSHIVHTATAYKAHHSSSDITTMIDSNVKFGVELLQAAHLSGTQTFINLCSAWQAYKGEPDSARTLYAASKNAFLDFTKYFRDVHQLDSRNVYLFDTYGPHDSRGKILNLLLTHAQTKTPIEMSSGTQLINATHIDDVCRGISAVIDTKDSLIDYQLRNERSHTLREFVTLVEQIIEKKIPVTWDAKPDRPFEMLFDWNIAPTPNSWVPEITLEQGILQLWDTEFD